MMEEKGKEAEDAWHCLYAPRLGILQYLASPTRHLLPNAEVWRVTSQNMQEG